MFDSLWQTYLPLLYSWTTWKWWTCRKRNYCKSFQKHWHTGRFISNNFIIPDEFLFYCRVVPWKGQTARTGWLDCSVWKGNNSYTLLLEQKPILAVQITLGLQCILCKLTWLALNCVQKCHNGKNGKSGAKLPEALQKFKCDY